MARRRALLSIIVLPASSSLMAPQISSHSAAILALKAGEAAQRQPPERFVFVQPRPTGARHPEGAEPRSGSGKTVGRTGQTRIPPLSGNRTASSRWTRKPLVGRGRHRSRRGIAGAGPRRAQPRRPRISCRSPSAAPQVPRPRRNRPAAWCERRRPLSGYPLAMRCGTALR